MENSPPKFYESIIKINNYATINFVYYIVNIIVYSEILIDQSY